jgi:hypothetical protein
MGILWTKPLKMQKFFTHFRHPKVIEDATKKVGHSHYFLKNINKTGLPRIDPKVVSTINNKYNKSIINNILCQ